MPLKNFCFILLLSGFFIQASCKKGSSGTITPDPPPVTPTAFMDYWVTKGDQTVLLQKQAALGFGKISNSYSFIDVDSTQTFQDIDGFGFTVTGGSAYLINRLPAVEKTALLRELFSTDADAISVSYLRISIGASDLNASVGVDQKVVIYRVYTGGLRVEVRWAYPALFYQPQRTDSGLSLPGQPKSTAC